MSYNRLKLNPDKSQFIRLHPWQQFKRFAADPFTMQCGAVIIPTILVCDLGCILDSKSTTEDYISSIVCGCMFQLRQLRSVRQSVTDDTAAFLVHAFITSIIDNCDSVLYGVSGRIPLILHKLQLI